VPTFHEGDMDVGGVRIFQTPNVDIPVRAHMIAAL
jgi:hypothetical protein